MSDYEVSNSEIKMFRQCRRRWWLTYILKLRKRELEVVGALPFGSRIHKALEAYYRDSEDPLAVHQKLIEDARAAMLIEGEDPCKLNDEAELGRVMLEGYLEWVAVEGIDANLSVIGVEEVLRYPMLQGAVTLTGKLDLRVRDNSTGTKLVLDLKTSANFSEFHLTGNINPQLKTYQILDTLTHPEEERIAGGVFRLLKKVKRTPRAVPPFYQDVVIRHNKYTLRSFWMQLQGTLRDMVTSRNALLSGADPMVYAYPNPTRECTWNCAFLAICPMFDDGSDVDAAIDAMYKLHNPYEHYDNVDKTV